MATARTARPVKLFVGLLGSDPDLLRRARQHLVRRFGPTDHESPQWPFTHTAYYADEMGPDLLRWFLSLERLVRPHALAEIKSDTNQLEQSIAEEALAVTPRPVNLDPGYLDLGKVVLATTKDRSHRIYLGLGIYAEVTLHYADGAWRAWPWTYPDYQSDEYRGFFAEVRTRYREQRQAEADGPAREDRA